MKYEKEKWFDVILLDTNFNIFNIFFRKQAELHWTENDFLDQKLRFGLWNLKDTYVGMKTNYLYYILIVKQLNRIQRLMNWE